MNLPSALHELARLHGVQTAYTDMTGRQLDASEVTLKAVLGALGAPADSSQQIRHSLLRARRRPWIERIPPVTVAWGRRPSHVEVRLSARSAGRLAQAVLRLETGETLKLPLGRNGPVVATETIGGETYNAVRLPLPALADGYHDLEVEIGGKVCHCQVIATPVRSYSDPANRRAWGLFLPMYAAHSKTSWGAGNFTDWQRLCTEVGALGAGICGTLPLLAAFLDHPGCDPSPYAPASRLFWNEFFLDITRVPEFAASAGATRLAGSAVFQERLTAFRADRRVDYRQQWKARRAVLERMSRHFFDNESPRQAAFERFLRERPEVEHYARFRAVCDRTRASWHSWPHRLRSGDLREGDYDEKTKRFHSYIQWLAQEQISDVIARCRKQGVKLYLDLPLGVHGGGYDVWRERPSFALDAAAGAPPDMFFTKGQNWGFAPLHPQRIRAQRYHYVLDFLRFQMRHTGLLRIDHVMALHRLYWIPRGFSPTEGAYVSYPAEELYALLCLESHRHRTVLVGENLGTVPPEVDRGMKRHGMRTLFVVPFEQRADPKAALRTPPRHCVASLNTHDMPTFAAHWRGLDIAGQVDLGLVPEGQVRQKRAERKKLNTAIAAFLIEAGWLKGPATASRVMEALLHWLAAGPAELVLVNLEDLLGETLPQNTPGTSTERPNWQRKARGTLESMLDQRKVRSLLARINELRRDRGGSVAAQSRPA